VPPAVVPFAGTRRRANAAGVQIAARHQRMTPAEEGPRLGPARGASAVGAPTLSRQPEHRNVAARRKAAHEPAARGQPPARHGRGATASPLARAPPSGSQIRCRRLRDRRHRMQPEYPWHRSRFRAPRAPQPEHQRGDRCEGMAVYIAQIDRLACAAARAEHVEPWRSRDQRGPDRGRPQHVPAGGKLLIPTVDDGLRLGARGKLRGLGISLRSIRAAGFFRSAQPPLPP
jgi:hypothetical protein